MAEVTWFKVLTDIFSDDKIKIIQSMPEGDALLVMWFKVLSQAGKTNDGGYIYLRKSIPYTPAMLATLFNKPQMIVELGLKLFVDFEMIDIDDKGYLFVTNWEKHQSIDALEKIKEQTKLRVKNHREKKKNELMNSNVTVTTKVTHGNAIEVDKELDIELISTTIGETLEEVHLKVFGKIMMSPLMSQFIRNIKKQGYTDEFIREIMLEAGESGNNPSIRFMESIFKRWQKEKINTRAEARNRKEAHKQKPDNKNDPQLENRRREIAFNRHMNNGGHENEFIYNT